MQGELCIGPSSEGNSHYRCLPKIQGRSLRLFKPWKILATNVLKNKNLTSLTSTEEKDQERKTPRLARYTRCAELVFVVVLRGEKSIPGID